MAGSSPSSPPSTSVRFASALRFASGILARWYWYIPTTLVDLADFYRNHLLAVLPNGFARWSPDLPGEWLGPLAGLGVAVAAALTYEELYATSIAERSRLDRRVSIEFDPAPDTHERTHDIGGKLTIQRTLTVRVRSRCGLTIDDVELRLASCHPWVGHIALPAPLLLANEQRARHDQAAQSHTLAPDTDLTFKLATKHTPKARSGSNGELVALHTLPGHERLPAGTPYLVEVVATGRDAATCQAHFVLDEDASGLLQCRRASHEELAAADAAPPIERPPIKHVSPRPRRVRFVSSWMHRERDPYHW